MNTNKRGQISGGYYSSFTDKCLLDDSATHPTFDLSIIGKAMRLHQNDAVAQYFEEGNHLINHIDGVSAEFEEESKQPLNKCCDYYNDSMPVNITQEGLILMDRYDGRSLLQDYREYCVGSFENNKNNDNIIITYPGDNEENESVMQELMMERFGSLPEYKELCRVSQQTATTSKPTTTITTEQNANKLASQEETFVLAKETLSKLPLGITLPQTRRQNQVIYMAAEKSVTTPQFEVLLKVKQSNNQEFTFLREEDPLNPYFMYLKQQEQLKRNRGNLEDVSNASHSKQESRLLVDYDSSSSDGINSTTSGRSKDGMMLAGYSSSDDEESIKIEPALNAANPLEEQVSLPSGEASEKDRRLKRARLLQGHFALKMLDR